MGRGRSIDLRARARSTSTRSSGSVRDPRGAPWRLRGSRMRRTDGHCPEPHADRTIRRTAPSVRDLIRSLSSLSPSSSAWQRIRSRLRWCNNRDAVVDRHSDPLVIDVDRLVAGRHHDRGFLFRFTTKRLIETEHSGGHDGSDSAVSPPCRADRIERRQKFDLSVVISRHGPTLPVSMPRRSAGPRLRFACA